MKTIQVTDEMYDFLIELSKELNTQDNRCTAMPYYFTVRETKEVPAHEGCGEEVLYSSEYETELRTEEEKREWIKEHEEYFQGTIFKCEAADIENQTSYDLDIMLGELCFDKIYVNTDYTYDNCFLTSKACDEHIRINRHNLKQPVNYLNHAFRNPELEKVLKFLRGLTNCKLHK